MRLNWLKLLHDPLLLVEPRLHLHYAVQTLAAFGDTILEKQADWSHASLDYDSEQNAFCSQSLSRHEGELRTALKLPGLVLELQNGQECLARTSLYERNLNNAIEWLRAVLQANGAHAEALCLPQYPDFPEHSLAHPNGSAFSREHEGGMSELGRYYGNTLAVLQEYLAQKSDIQPVVRTWPHHFDMAALITIKEPSKPGGEDGCSVGLGMSPGDARYPGPYWYVSPWPYFAKEKLKTLKAGVWHTEGWLGAILEAKEIMSANTEQSRTVHDFIQSAADLCLEILDTTPS